ncbi:MAG: carboxypeptidase regulatory-like domain-containing protein, partial [Vicinamibacterales bacterium]
MLPGVTVEASSAALIEGTKTAVTDAAGQYRVVDLRPGKYDITFSLQGFQTLRHEGVALGASFTATINPVLTTAAVAETIVVSGESPLVDVRTNASERSLNQELIEHVPTGRGIFTLVALVPGATFNVPDVAGSQTHQLQSVSVHGSSTNDTSWRADGLDISASLGSGGLSATYFNQGLQQEVSVQSKALSAEIGGGGVSIDMITKDGGNRFAGVVFLSYANATFQADNVSSDQRARGLTAPSGVESLLDVNPSLGGPIVRDRLWFYTSYRYWKNDRLVAQTFNTDGTQALDEQLLTFYPSLKLTGRLNDSSRLSGFIDWNRKDRLHRRDRSGTIQFIAPEASLFQRQYGPTANVKWTSTFSSDVLLEAGFSGEFINSRRIYQPAIAEDAVPKNDLVLTTLTGAAHPSVLVPYSISRARQWTVAASWMPTWKGQHSIRAGLQWRQMPYRTGRATDQHGDLIARFRNGVPDSVLVHNTPVDERYYMYDTGLFVQDSWTIKRITMNIGTRFERFVGNIEEQRSEAGRFVPARTFSAIEHVPV